MWNGPLIIRGLIPEEGMAVPFEYLMWECLQCGSLVCEDKKQLHEDHHSTAELVHRLA